MLCTMFTTMAERERERERGKKREIEEACDLVLRPPAAFHPGPLLSYLVVQ